MRAAPSPSRNRHHLTFAGTAGIDFSVYAYAGIGAEYRKDSLQSAGEWNGIGVENIAMTVTKTLRGHAKTCTYYASCGYQSKVVITSLLRTAHKMSDLGTETSAMGYQRKNLVATLDHTTCFLSRGFQMKRENRATFSCRFSRCCRFFARCVFMSSGSQFRVFTRRVQQFIRPYHRDHSYDTANMLPSAILLGVPLR